MTKKVKAKKRNRSIMPDVNTKVDMKGDFGKLRLPKKRNYKATDATRINIDALKKRIKALEIKINHVYKVCFCE